MAQQNNFGGLSIFSYAIRGVTTSEIYQNGFPLNRGTPPPPDAQNIERIEVLKGPGAGLFGRSDPGGLVNPFAFGIPITYVHDGFAEHNGRQLVRLSFTGNVLNPTVDFGDDSSNITVNSITVGGELIFDPQAGAVVTSTSQWNVSITIVDPATDITADMTIIGNATASGQEQ